MREYPDDRVLPEFARMQAYTRMQERAEAAEEKLAAAEAVVEAARNAVKVWGAAPTARLYSVSWGALNLEMNHELPAALATYDSTPGGQ